MSAPFPLFVDLEGRTCLVVGAGSIGGPRAVRLAGAGARVRLVSPELGDVARDAVASGRVAEHHARGFRPDDLDGCVLAVAATDRRDVNRSVAQAARSRGVWCNVTDAPAEGDVIVPAAVTRGDLQIALTTGGASPAVAADIRARLEGTFGPEWGDLLALLGRMRDDLKTRHPDPARRARHVRAVLESDVREMLSRGDTPQAERLARTLMDLGD